MPYYKERNTYSRSIQCPCFLNLFSISISAGQERALRIAARSAPPESISKALGGWYPQGIVGYWDAETVKKARELLQGIPETLCKRKGREDKPGYPIPSDFPSAGEVLWLKAEAMRLLLEVLNHGAIIQYGVDFDPAIPLCEDRGAEYVIGNEKGKWAFEEAHKDMFLYARVLGTNELPKIHFFRGYKEFFSCSIPKNAHIVPMSPEAWAIFPSDTEVMTPNNGADEDFTEDAETSVLVYNKPQGYKYISIVNHARQQVQVIDTESLKN